MPDIETLKSIHPDANDPAEPYCGVGVLFNGDAQKFLDDRKDWEVVSPYQIVFVDREVIKDEKKES